ncbi:uncharacterized protein LOC134853177 [Symsagittifera roscoffensis]|uniref:uncharacterized protein LOC134853177 n=1 Tax=Symsagittifera roscoffensis TaxID=84072 RepID=UPI00307B4469
MPHTGNISCVVWGRKGYGKTTLRENLAALFCEHSGAEHQKRRDNSGSGHGGGKGGQKKKQKSLLDKPRPNMKSVVSVTSRAWFGLTADTVSSLANSYPIRVELKEMGCSWYSLESEYYLGQLRSAGVIMYVIDSTARWEIHEERPLFERFLHEIYGQGMGPPLCVVFTKCDCEGAESEWMEEAMGLTERSWTCWPNIPDYRLLKVQSEDRISDDIHTPTTAVCKKAYDMRNTMATILILAQNNAPLSTTTGTGTGGTDEHASSTTYTHSPAHRQQQQ